MRLLGVRSTGVTTGPGIHHFVFHLFCFFGLLALVRRSMDAKQGEKRAKTTCMPRTIEHVFFFIERQNLRGRRREGKVLRSRKRLRLEHRREPPKTRPRYPSGTRIRFQLLFRVAVVALCVVVWVRTRLNSLGIFFSFYLHLFFYTKTSIIRTFGSSAISQIA